MIALDGYGTRLNRIEQYYTDNKIIEQTNRMFQDTTSRIDEVKRSMENQLYDMCNSIDKSFNESDFKNKIEYICTYMKELDAATNDKITHYTTQMFQDFTYKVDGMTGRLTNQIADMNNSIEKSHNSVKIFLLEFKTPYSHKTVTCKLYCINPITGIIFTEIYSYTH